MLPLLSILLTLAAGFLLGYQLGKVRGESPEDATERAEWAEWRDRFYSTPKRPKPGRPWLAPRSGGYQATGAGPMPTEPPPGRGGAAGGGLLTDADGLTGVFFI